MTPEEFCEKLARAEMEFPRESEDALKKGARKMVKALQNNSPFTTVEHKNKLNKSWRMRIEGTSSNNLKADIYSTAPHFHLVDRGHVQKAPGGRVTGFVQGSHFLQKTIDDEGDDIQHEMGEKLLKKLGADLR
nr:MAG TPA: putative tail component [Caudoviricetes sp.]